MPKKKATKEIAGDSVLVTAAKSIGKAAGKIVSVVSETADKARALADRAKQPAKKARKPATKNKKKTAVKKAAVLPKIKKRVGKSKQLSSS